MDPIEIEKLEVELLIETLYHRYGYDFRQYARASIRRRVRHWLAKTGHQHVSELLPSVLYDENFAQQALDSFSITVTEMFRDPAFYHAVRQHVIPYLRTYPFIKIWVAGCASGEEVYSLAILLHEEGLYERTKIYATDFNHNALKRAAEGIYPLKDIQHYTSNYQKAGGLQPFSNYYHAEYGSAILTPQLKSNLIFAHHNLVSEGVFTDVHLVFCRNVLIYFDRALQNRVLETLSNSLPHGGFLCLGSKETLDLSGVARHFKPVDRAARIYQKRLLERSV